MKRYTSLATLAAVAALGAGLFVVNTVNHPAGRAAAEQRAAATAPGPAAPDPAVPAPAAPAPEPAPEWAFTGRSAGNEVTVAIAVKQGRAVGYVCDGEEIEAWFEGTLDGDTLALTGADGKATIGGTASGKSSLGSVTVGGEEWPFSAQVVDAPAGLYEGSATVRGVATRVGWIVGCDGDVTGVASAAGERGPAPALDPADPGAATIDGAPVEVSAIDGGDAVIRR